MRSKRKPPLNAPSLTACVNLFLIAQQAQRSTPRTVANYRQLLTHFADWLTQRSVTTPAGITPEHIRQYLAGLDGYSAWYIHGHARTVKTWLRFLHAEHVITENPMTGVKMPRLERRILPSFTPADVRALVAACAQSQNPHRDAAIVLTLLDTGCRAAECCALTVGDVDAKTGAVYIRQGKGRKDRVTRLGNRARKAVLRYLLERGATTDTAPLFVSEKDGGCLTPNGLLLLVRRIGDRAGVHAHPHKFRRTCAITLHRAGVPITSIALLLGHNDLETLRLYLDLQAQDGLDAHELGAPADNLLDGKRRGQR